MVKIQQIMASGSKRQIHLLGDPDGSITETVELRLFSGTRHNRALSPLLASFGDATRRRSKIDWSLPTRFVCQAQTDFLPTQLPCLSSISWRCCGHGIHRFHHRQHAAIHLGDERGHSRLIGPFTALLMPHQHGGAVLFRDRSNRAHGNFNPVVFPQLCRGSHERLVRTKVRDCLLQPFRTATAFHLC